MEEEWKPINGYPDYAISTLGNVKSFKRCKEGRSMKQDLSNKGYYRVGLRNKGDKQRHYAVHRLIAIHFIDNPNNKPICDHINRIRNDNRLVNLRWATHSENNLNTVWPKGGVWQNKKYAELGKKSWRVQWYIKRDRNEKGNVKSLYFNTKEEAENHRQKMYDKYSRLDTLNS